MYENKKISVIVPVYNVQNELSRCIESILMQTYGNLELILVDDGSLDNSSQIIRQYAERDNRIVTIFKTNGGVTSARLEGVRRATGNYIGFVDGDDEIEADMYEVLMANALTYDAQISHCGYQMVFDDGRTHYFYNTGRLIEQNNLTALRDLLEGKFIEPGLCNKLFHKALFDELLKYNLLDTTIRINEDLLMNYYLFKKSNKSIFVDKCKYHYIVRNNSASRQNLNYHKIYDPIRVKRIILKDCYDEIKIDAEKALVNTCIYGYCSLVMNDNKLKKEKHDVRKVIKAHYNSVKLLSKRTAILGLLIINVPGIFEVIYPIYVKMFQKKKYD